MLLDTVNMVPYVEYDTSILHKKNERESGERDHLA